jgi:hypothetical protein
VGKWVWVERAHVCVYWGWQRFPYSSIQSFKVHIFVQYWCTCYLTETRFCIHVWRSQVPTQTLGQVSLLLLVRLLGRTKGMSKQLFCITNTTRTKIYTSDFRKPPTCFGRSNNNNKSYFCTSSFFVIPNHQSPSSCFTVSGTYLVFAQT